MSRRQRDCVWSICKSIQITSTDREGANRWNGLDLLLWPLSFPSGVRREQLLLLLRQRPPLQWQKHRWIDRSDRAVLATATQIEASIAVFKHPIRRLKVVPNRIRSIVRKIVVIRSKVIRKVRPYPRATVLDLCRRRKCRQWNKRICTSRSSSAINNSSSTEPLRSLNANFLLRRLFYEVYLIHTDPQWWVVAANNNTTTTTTTNNRRKMVSIHHHSTATIRHITTWTRVRFTAKAGSSSRMPPTAIRHRRQRQNRAATTCYTDATKVLN